MLSPIYRNFLEELSKAGGHELTVGDWEVLEADAANAAEYKGRIGPIMSALMRGFLHLAAKGHTFVEADRIAQHFGSTLRNNYPEASAPFLRFATTYWTYLFWLNDHDAAVGDATAYGLIGSIEEQIRPVFFPTPGPVKIKASVREAKQREILAQFDVPIDVEEFISGNPILIRDRQKASRGCLGMLLFPMLGS